MTTNTTTANVATQPVLTKAHVARLIEGFINEQTGEQPTIITNRHGVAVQFAGATLRYDDGAVTVTGTPTPEQQGIINDIRALIAQATSDAE
jgi:hypothetical protein